MTYLPNEVLSMVCTQLWHKRDFNTLFSCACSGKRLAPIALMNLYRTQGNAPVPYGYHDKDIDEEIFAPDDSLFQPPDPYLATRIGCKFIGLWRTIILSSLGKTLYPYSQNIRTLNLHNLEMLLEACRWSAVKREKFFQGELAQFVVVELGSNAVEKTVKRIGEGEGAQSSSGVYSKVLSAITKQTPQLEELIGDVDSEALSRWIPRLPRLIYLKPKFGEAVEGNGNLIRLHCPLLKGLNFLEGGGTNSDRGLAAFVNELRPQSLESFETFRHHHLGGESIKALSRHGESLNKLKLYMLQSSILHISLLKGCRNLVTFSLSGIRMFNHHSDELCNNAFIETVAWLKGCKKLRALAFDVCCNDPALMAPVLLDNSIHLTFLQYNGFITKDVRIFYQALANQTCLQTFWLTLLGTEGAHEDGVTRENGLVECLSKLVNLTNLRLNGMYDILFDPHIGQLARSLPKLEIWVIQGYGFTSAILGEFACLRSLRGLDLNIATGFTADDILNFIEKLGPGNKGLALVLRNFGKKVKISVAEGALIRERIWEKTKGRFELH